MLAAGGFTPDQMDMSVQAFMSAFCKGGVKEVMPNAFNDWTIGSVQRRAKSGDAKARACLKLLGRPEYRR